jgi:hypothetical protein
MGGVVEVAPRRTALGPGRPAISIHNDVAHQGQIQYDAVVHGSESRDAMPTASDRHGEVVLPSEVHGRHHVLDGGGLHDGPGLRSIMAL